METKKQLPQAIFQRRSPRSDQSKTFKMDELDVDAMINAIKQERYVLRFKRKDKSLNAFKTLHSETKTRDTTKKRFLAL